MRKVWLGAVLAGILAATFGSPVLANPSQRGHDGGRDRPRPERVLTSVLKVLAAPTHRDHRPPRDYYDTLPRYDDHGRLRGGEGYRHDRYWSPPPPPRPRYHGYDYYDTLPYYDDYGRRRNGDGCRYDCDYWPSLPPPPPPPPYYSRPRPVEIVEVSQQFTLYIRPKRCAADDPRVVVAKFKATPSEIGITNRINFYSGNTVVAVVDINKKKSAPEDNILEGALFAPAWDKLNLAGVTSIRLVKRSP